VKILIVDDEKPARDRLAQILADEDGYEVVGEAGNGNEALQRTSELEPDIVLLDKDPLESISNATSVWKVIQGGKIFSSMAEAE